MTFRTHHLLAAAAALAIPTHATAQIDTTARGIAAQARSSATAIQTTANLPLGTVMYAANYGVVADCSTDNASALYNAINAAQTAGSTYSAAYFRKVVLPAGCVRIASPVTVFNNLTSVGFELDGAGFNGTTLYADFAFTYPAPQFTISGGGCTTAPVLYPMIDSGALTQVNVISGGAGCSSAPTATLVTYNKSGTQVGSGATVSLSVTSGAVTSATVTASGSGYAATYLGDALVVRGFNVAIKDIAITSSATRAAASNGGTSAYPYFTTNNGIRYEPFASLGQTTQYDRLERVTVSGQPGHGINAARLESARLDQVSATGNGGDGLFLHTQGGAAGSYGIDNTIQGYRATGNCQRGLTINAMGMGSTIDPAIFANLQCAGAYGYATVSGGVVTGVSVKKSGMLYTSAPTVSFSGGGGSGATATATISNGKVTGVTITAGGTGYTSAPTVSFSGGGVPGLAPGVNEEVLFNLDYGQRFNGDVESNLGLSAGFDLVTIAGSYGGEFNGAFRGGRMGLNLNTVYNATFDNITHIGNAWDVSNAILFYQGGTGYLTSGAGRSIYVGQAVYNLGSVNLNANWTPSNNPFVTGFGGGNGTFYFAGLAGTAYPITYASTVTPAPGNGSDQYLTLTGNVTIANPSSNPNGQRLKLILVENATGGYSVTFGSAYVGANVGSIGSGAANKIGVIEFHCVVTGGRTVWVQDYWSGWL